MIYYSSTTLMLLGVLALYCYSCDDDVRDEFLPAHLSTFGIDVLIMSKTEKTVSEMNVDINNNLRLSNTLEKGRLLVPVFGPGFTGITNVGNSCYMASAIQLLLNIPEFVKRYASLDGQMHLAECKKHAPECIKCQTTKLVHGLMSGDYSKPIKEPEVLMDKQGKPLPEEFQFRQEGIRPLMFKTLIGKGHQEFQTNKQQDAIEYLTYFLSKLDVKPKLNPKRNWAIPNLAKNRLWRKLKEFQRLRTNSKTKW